MALTINTNVASLNAQRQLLNSGNDLDQASERLASGRRVNNAADDAAGLAIANRLTSQIRGLDQAIRNANDGISLIQTAEGALNETTNILQRIRELSIQSSNGIYSDADRSTLDAEVQQLKEELDRIATSTTFNGQPILDGSLGSVTLQAGSEAADTIDLEIAAVDTKALGGQDTGDVIGSEVVGATDNIAGALDTLTQITDAATATTFSINQQSVGILSTAANVGEAIASINANVSGVETTAFVEMVASNVGSGIVRGTDTVSITLNLQDGSENVLEIRNTGSLEQFVERANELGGDSLKASINDGGSLVLQSNAAAFITVGNTSGTAASAATGLADLTQAFQLSFKATAEDVTAVDLDLGSTLTAASSSIGLSSRTAGDITGIAITAGTAIEVGALQINGVDIGEVSAGLTTSGNTVAVQQAINVAAAINALSAEHNVVASQLSGVLTLNSISGDEIQFIQNDPIVLADTGLITTNISESQGDTVSSIAIGTEAGARNALNVVDVALEQINSIRADLGAINNRLDFTINNLSNVVENTSASRSRILDADFAAESAALSRAQVLQQASQAILAQANARPQQVLQLLQN
jgi:flagellin